MAETNEKPKFTNPGHPRGAAAKINEPAGDEKLAKKIDAARKAKAGQSVGSNGKKS